MITKADVALPPLLPGLVCFDSAAVLLPRHLLVARDADSLSFRFDLMEMC
jgi:hypothetical protein